MPVAVANTFMLPAVTMVFDSFSRSKFLMLSRRVGVSSLSVKWSDAPLFTITVNLSLLG